MSSVWGVGVVAVGVGDEEAVSERLGRGVGTEEEERYVEESGPCECRCTFTEEFVVPNFLPMKNPTKPPTPKTIAYRRHTFCGCNIFGSIFDSIPKFMRKQRRI